MRLWKSQIQQGNLSHFQTLSNKNTILSPGKVTKYNEQLQKLLNEFQGRFADFRAHEHSFEIFTSPFNMVVDSAPAAIQMELIELQERVDLKTKFLEEPNCGDFYRKYISKVDIPNLNIFVASKMAIFGSTYVCEQFFSKMGYMNSPYRSVLTNEHLENGLREEWIRI